MHNFSIYNGKKVLVTGHTGFKGSWLVLWLLSLGAEVYGYALKPETEPSMFRSVLTNSGIKSFYGDIIDKKNLEKIFDDIKPEFVFHLAAQSLVRKSYMQPLLTYETNVVGTLNVLEAARNCCSVRAFVNVTTDKCYENKESMQAYNEHDSLGGYDMYSSSKACVEIMSSAYRRSFLQKHDSYKMATVRSGNVIGGGDWAQDRIVPDCIRALQKNEPIVIRNPAAVRPWQHVLEPLAGYLTLGEKLYTTSESFCEAFNFGPDENNAITVEQLVQKIVEYWGSVSIVVKTDNSFHEANLLLLNAQKAKKLLNWTPMYSADEAIKKTIEWYKIFYDCGNILDFTLQQIKDYERVLSGKTAQKLC